MPDFYDFDAAGCDRHIEGDRDRERPRRLPSLCVGCGLVRTRNYYCNSCRRKGYRDER